VLIFRDCYDPHQIIKVDYQKYLEYYDKKLERMNIILDLVKRYSLTLDEKIESIIN